MNLDPVNRDLLVRTVMSEAGDQSDEGKAAVAHVILNRLNSGKWGNNVAGVVLAHGQFEPWGLNRSHKNYPMRHDPSSAAYRKAAAVVDDAASGDVEDPTGGATHFLQEDIVRKRRGGSLPPWAKGEGQKIGDHTFYKPEGENALGGINRAIGKDTGTSTQALGFSNEFEPGSILKKLTTSPEEKPAAEKTQTEPEFEKGSVFKALGVGEDKKSEAKPPPDPTKPDMGPLNKHLEQPDVVPKLSKEEQQRTRENEYAPLRAMKETYERGGAQISQGAQEIKSGLSATGVGNVGMGLLGATAGALYAPIEETIKEVGRGFGQPVAAEKLQFVLPGANVAKGVKAALPSTRAINQVSKLIPDADVAKTIQDLERNKRLSVPDVSPAAQSAVMGMRVNPETPKAQAAVTDWVANRRAAEKVSAQEAMEKLDKLPDPLAVLDTIKGKAAEVGKNVIEPIVSKAKPADVSSVIKGIDSELASAHGRTLTPYQQRLERLRDEIRGVWDDRARMYADVGGENGLHRIQSRLREEAQNLLNSSVGSERTLGKDLMDMRNKLVGAIDAKNGGYKDALGKYREANEVHGAFERGFNFGRNRSSVAGLEEDSAAAWGKWWKTATDEEKEATRLGALSSMTQDLKVIRGARKVEHIPESEPNIDKLKMMFGDKRAKEFADTMNDARKVAQTNARVEGGAQTAERLLGDKAFGVRKVGEGKPPGIGTFLPALADTVLSSYSGIPGTGLALTGAGLGLKGLHHLYERAGRAGDIRTRERAAELLTGAGPKELKDLLTNLKSRQAQIAAGAGRRGLSQKIGNASSSPLFKMLAP